MKVLHVKITDTEIARNGEPGASFEAQSTGIGSIPDVRLDLGGGGLGSPGGNCLFGNGSGDVEATNLPVVAGHDWWGHPGAPNSSQTVTHGIGSISSAGALPSRPSCGP
jgi:hypothetical protein